MACRKTGLFGREERHFLYFNHLSKEYLDQMIPYLKALTVNPQKIVRLSFSSLVFLMRLSFEVFSKLKSLGKKFIPQMKGFDVKA